MFLVVAGGQKAEVLGMKVVDGLKCKGLGGFEPKRAAGTFPNAVRALLGHSMHLFHEAVHSKRLFFVGS